MNKEQEKEIQKAICDTRPDQLKLPFALWTRKAVQQLIKQLWGLEVPIRTIGDYLKRWHFTPQKPFHLRYVNTEGGDTVIAKVEGNAKIQ